MNPDSPEQQSYPSALKDARSVAGKTLIRIDSRGRADIDAALAKAAADRIDALFVADESHIAGDPEVRRRVLAFAADARIPAASAHQNYVRDGALIAMGAPIPVLAAGAASYVDKILRGASDENGAASSSLWTFIGFHLPQWQSGAVRILHIQMLVNWSRVGTTLRPVVPPVLPNPRSNTRYRR